MNTRVVGSAVTLDYVKTIGIVNNGDNGRGFTNPYDIAVSRDGRIYVLNRCDPFRRAAIRVGICNLDEDYLGEFGYGYGDGDGQLMLPTCMAFDGRQRLHVTDEQVHRVSVFDLTGKFLGKWGTHGLGDGELDGPAGIAFDSGDNVYVADQHNHRIQKFDLDGGFLASFGESGIGDCQFHRPSSVVVDDKGNIYVADWGNERVQVLGPDGVFLWNERGRATLSRWAQEFFASNPDEMSVREQSDLVSELPEHLSDPYHVSSQTEPYFWGPVSVSLDAEGRIYVPETNRHRFQVYRLSSA